MNDDAPNGQPTKPVAMRGLPPTKTIVYDQFSYEIVTHLELGRRDIILTTPHGERVILPFEQSKAEEFARKMLAPSIEVPRPTIE